MVSVTAMKYRPMPVPSRIAYNALGPTIGLQAPILAVMVTAMRAHESGLQMDENKSWAAQLSKPAILGWIASLAGMALWLYGYLVTGHPSLIDWRADTPWWIADFLPNIESEIGMALVCVGSVLVYWPLLSDTDRDRPS